MCNFSPIGQNVADRYGMSNRTGAARNRITSGLVLLGFVERCRRPTGSRRRVGPGDHHVHLHREHRTVTVPAGVSSMTVTLKGGQGGRGGYDSQGSPTPGGYQGVVTGVIAVKPGEEITVAVGRGGGTGNSSQGSAAGGYAGKNPLAGTAEPAAVSPDRKAGRAAAAGVVLRRCCRSDDRDRGWRRRWQRRQRRVLSHRRASCRRVARARADTTSSRPGGPAWTPDHVQPGFPLDGGASGAGGGGAEGGEQGAVQYGGDYATEYFGFGGYPGANSTAGLTGLTTSYDYYAENSANGTITITYDDGAPSAPINLAGTGGTTLSC